jgi:hypothetical protein
MKKAERPKMKQKRKRRKGGGKGRETHAQERERMMTVAGKRVGMSGYCKFRYSPL